MRDVYGAKTEKAQWLRFHTQTAGVSLTAQQPYNNVVRTGIEALSAVLGGTNSLHTNALDETLALPSEQAAEIALRTQQVIMEETGVVNVADPLGGSWYVEALTDQIEAEANAIFDKILAMGGSDPHPRRHRGARRGVRGRGEADAAEWPMTRACCAASRTAGSCREIAEAAFQYQVALEKGEKKIVGVNVPHRLDHPRPRDPAGLPRGRGRAGPRARRAPYGARRGRGAAARSQRMVEVAPHRRQHDRGDARGLPRRGHARRDLRRAARRVGRVPRAGPLLTRAGPGPSGAARGRGSPVRPA